uniref:Zinc finger and SCAN domain containing 5B n=1 Tax=Pipistrellus kuhlii TaxID=59472 RepID=A0A7J7QWW1_PIPKU|nr:hypothetical protein mPipKuh1_008230 [Pipistrellus kuhlii]
MATFQVFSSGPGSAQGSLGWALPPTGWPQGCLTERQYEDSEWWHRRFREFQPSEGSDPLQSLHTIKESLNLWMRPDMRSTQQILDQLVLEKFMTCMPLELQVLVRERKVQSCEELEALLRKKEKPRKWRVLTIQGREYLLENSEEDLVLDLSMKSSTPISEARAHPGNGPEVLGEPGNHPGPSDVAWGQRMVAVEEQEYSDEEVWDTPLVIDLSARSPTPISEAGEHPDNSPEEYPTHVPECGDCNKRFSHRGNLNVHLRTHSGVRPYRCPRCDGAFRQLGTFQRHQRTCHGALQGRRDPADPEVQPRVLFEAEMVHEHVDT